MLTNEEKITIAQCVREVLRSDQSHEEESKLFASLTAQYGQPEELDELIEKELDAWLERSNFCPNCGEPSPEPFLAPDPVWQFYVEPRFQKRSLCLECFEAFVAKKDGGVFERKRGKVAGWPGGYPLPEGGYEKFFQMTVAQKAKFYDWAARSGYWDWLDQRNFVKNEQPTKSPRKLSG
jgi:hypothetical protein